MFVLLDVGTRRIVHWNLTDHPKSEWTIQQFRNSLPLEGTYRFVIHDRDGIFAPAVDEALRSMSLQVLKTPVRAPQANAHCERFIGTARHECLDWMIPLNERHLRSVLVEWISHYNRERPLPRWVVDSRITQNAERPSPDIAYRPRIVSSAARVSAACIITTSWNLSRHRFLRSTGVDGTVRVLKTPVRTPQANAFCERLIGTIRRECLDWLIPLNELHLQRILREWVTHYNRGRPHASLGPGIPEASAAPNSLVALGHHFPARCRVVATPILSRLHHEYRWVPAAA